MIRISLVVGVVLHISTVALSAKTTAIYGEDLRFWDDHRMFVGVVEEVVQREGRHDIVIRVSECIGADSGEDLDVVVGRLSDGLAVIEEQRISKGSTVLVLAKRVCSRWIILNEPRVLYMMMPHPRRSLYRVRTENDPHAARTLAICRAISTVDPNRQAEMILGLVEKDRSHLGYFRMYLDRRARRMKSATEKVTWTYEQILDLSRSVPPEGNAR